MNRDSEKIEVLVTRLAELLEARDWMLATAESCTGGWVAKVCTDRAGSSHWYERGFVTYTNESKQELLGVRAATLEKCGAVSEEVVAEMARGALDHSRAEVSLSISGIAGPGGGTPEKPVGMVCFGWGLRGAEPITEQVRFDGDRDAVRRQAVVHALQGAVDALA
jgi:nicotinamide-nucleotide amidase